MTKKVARKATPRKPTELVVPPAKPFDRRKATERVLLWVAVVRSAIDDLCSSVDGFLADMRTNPQICELIDIDQIRTLKHGLYEAVSGADNCSLSILDLPDPFDSGE